MDPFELEDAVEASDVATVRDLLGAGSDPNSPLHEVGTSVIELALSKSDQLMVRLLVEFGADFEQPDKTGASLLFRASGARDANPNVGLLLGLGADPNRPDDAGWTALHRAVSLGYEYNVAVLLRGGADWSLETSAGMNATDLARVSGHPDILDG